MAGLAPSRKVNAGAVTAAAMVVLVWVGKRFGDVEIPADVAIAISAVVTYLVQYLTPNPPPELR